MLCECIADERGDGTGLSTAIALTAAVRRADVDFKALWRGNGAPCLCRLARNKRAGGTHCDEVRGCVF